MADAVLRHDFHQMLNGIIRRTGDQVFGHQLIDPPVDDADTMFSQPDRQVTLREYAFGLVVRISDHDRADVMLLEKGDKDSNLGAGARRHDLFALGLENLPDEHSDTPFFHHAAAERRPIALRCNDVASQERPSVEVRPRLLTVLNDHQHDTSLNSNAKDDLSRVYRTSYVMAIFFEGMMTPRHCLACQRRLAPSPLYLSGLKRETRASM